VPLTGLKITGEPVGDLGSGAGMDSFLAARQLDALRFRE
jgi:hypothetical protein